MEKIVLSAMKQSKRAYLPQLHAPIPFSQLGIEQQGKNENLRYIAHCEESNKVPLWNNYQAGKDVLMLIGPEGDFSSSEINFAIEKSMFGNNAKALHRLNVLYYALLCCLLFSFLNGLFQFHFSFLYLAVLPNH